MGAQAVAIAVPENHIAADMPQRRAVVVTVQRDVAGGRRGVGRRNANIFVEVIAARRVVRHQPAAVRRPVKIHVAIAVGVIETGGKYGARVTAVASRHADRVAVLDKGDPVPVGAVARLKRVPALGAIDQAGFEGRGDGKARLVVVG